METSRAILTLSALAQGTRLKAFRRLVRAGEDGLAAGQLAEELGVPANTLSFHLKELSRSGLVQATRDGRSIRYTLNVAAMRDFLDFLSEDCCQGHPELCRAEEAVPLKRRMPDG